MLHSIQTFLSFPGQTWKKQNPVKKEEHNHHYRIWFLYSPCPPWSYKGNIWYADISNIQVHEPTISKHHGIDTYKCKWLMLQTYMYVYIYTYIYIYIYIYTYIHIYIYTYTYIYIHIYIYIYTYMILYTYIYIHIYIYIYKIHIHTYIYYIYTYTYNISVCVCQCGNVHVWTFACLSGLVQSCPVSSGLVWFCLHVPLYMYFMYVRTRIEGM